MVIIKADGDCEVIKVKPGYPSELENVAKAFHQGLWNA